MEQKINPHPAPGCNRSPHYYVFSKDAILGSVPSISSEVLDLVDISIFSLNHDIVRPTKIMNRADKNWTTKYFKN